MALVSPPDASDPRSEDAEVLAGALSCYARLSRALGSPRWKGVLRSRGDTLRTALELEPRVRALIERSSPRASRVLRARRRLEARARRRLARLSRWEGSSLGAVLERLETLLSEPRPLPPGRDEPVLLEGIQGWRQLLSWPGTWVFALLVLANRHLVMGSAPLVLLAGGALVGFFYLRYAGRFWLTSQRLVWKPRLGEPVQVPLASIVPEGITALPAWGEVRVEGARTLTVRHVGKAGRLAALLDLHRQAPFLGAVDGTPRVREVSVLPARRMSGGAGAERGVAVLRPGYAAFLPENRSVEVFRSLTGPRVRAPEADVTVALLVEHLRLLSESDFDAYLRQAVFSNDGELWPADEVGPGATKEAGRVCLVGARGVGMELRPDSAQAEATHRIVSRWVA